LKDKHKERILLLAISIISLAVFFTIWQLITEEWKLFQSYQLPSPLRLLKTFIGKFSNRNPDGATLPQHIWASVKVALTGFFIGSVFGVPAGIIMAWNKTADRFLRPIFDLLKPIPPIAWIPIMIMFFGIGLGAKAAVIFMGAAIPCLINSYTGIKQTSAVHVWVARTFGATRNKILFRVAIPTALPFIFTGLRISLANAWIALVAAELLASTNGLGFMIQMGRTFTRTDIVIIGMLTIGTIGALSSFLLKLVEDRFIRSRRKH